MPVKNGTTISSRQSRLSTNLEMLIPMLMEKYSIASSVLQTSIPLTITSRMGQETTISVSSALRRMAEAAQTKLT